MAFVLAAAPTSFPAERLTTDGRLKTDPVFVDRSGAEVVYVSEERPVQMRLMRLKLADRSVAPLHPTQDKSEFEAAFSTDGRYSAFVQSRGNLSLALMIQDTIPPGKEAEIKPAGGFSGPRSPAITPDGSRVAYSFAEEGRQQIFSVNREAGDRRVLVDSPGINNWPSFSPDGRQMVFASTRDEDFEIYIANADGTAPRRLTTSPRQDIRPRFSPDGKRITFTSNRDGNYEIYIMYADGTGLTRVTDHPERDDYACWHPDGKRLVVVSEREGKHDLYLVNVP